MRRKIYLEPDRFGIMHTSRRRTLLLGFAAWLIAAAITAALLAAQHAQLSLIIISVIVWALLFGGITVSRVRQIEIAEAKDNEHLEE